MDRRRMCLDHTEFLRRVDRRNGHLLTDSLKRSITPAGHRAAARGGTRIIPAPSFTQHSLLNAAIWPELNRQPLNHEAVPLPLSHRSHMKDLTFDYSSVCDL
ncbi:hypothetical protein Q8A67_012891 [Cirrhinus molitorella]|uniref:Uncharacterized protein n=1 Tax=Cirrhinus molitorella TaxID=172907 RepID=A0AA88PVE0_9TELE|nr:hypothetical protein Q8A67_012891 [Cirrhinus molitorella]